MFVSDRMREGGVPRHASLADCGELPLERDRPDDVPVATTRRGLARVALVAAEMGARIERSGASEDALEWMSAPRALFKGRDALTACLELEGCSRAVLVHMLEADWDAEDLDLDDFEGAGPERRRGAQLEGAGGSMRLFSCCSRGERDGEVLWTFDASVAGGPDEAREVLAARHGDALAAAADVREGFDPEDPHVSSLVCERLAEAIGVAAGDPGGGVAAGLDVSVVQRIRS